MNDNYFEQLQDHDWGGLMERLVLVACRFGRVSRTEVIGDGMTAEDVAAEAIRKTWSEDRRWNSDTCPDLFVHLVGAARSIVSNLRKKKEVAIVAHGSEENEGSHDALDQFRSDDLEPLDGLIDSRNQIALQKGIRKALAGVPSGEKICELLASGRSPRDIAALLRLPVVDLYNLNRLIKRRLAAYASSVSKTDL